MPRSQYAIVEFRGLLFLTGVYFTMDIEHHTQEDVKVGPCARISSLCPGLLDL